MNDSPERYKFTICEYRAPTTQTILILLAVQASVAGKQKIYKSQLKLQLDIFSSPIDLWGKYYTAWKLQAKTSLLYAF